MRGFLPGFILGALSIAGCAAVFPYRYYATQMPGECYDEGKLLGKLGAQGWPDRELKECKPDPEPSPGASPGIEVKRLKCITMIDDDFYALKDDDLKCHEALQTCQQGQPPKP